MFNPQLDELTWRTVERAKYITSNCSDIIWEEVNFIDLRRGNLFRLTDPNGERVKHENGNDQFVARSNPYILNGIPAIDI